MEEMEKLQEKITELEANVAERDKQTLELEQGTIDERVKGVLKLAGSHKDSEGNGYPRFLLEWAGKLMRFEEFGSDKNIVCLSDDDKPSLAMQKYVIVAVEELMDKVPGTVPLERKSKDDNGSDNDDYDYSEPWEDV